MNRHRVEMHVHSPIFQGQLIKKNRSITSIVWVPEKFEKMPKKGQKNEKKNIFFKNKYRISKCDTYSYINLTRAFQKPIFSICSFSHKKLLASLDFFHRLDFFSLCSPYPTLCI